MKPFRSAIPAGLLVALFALMTGPIGSAAPPAPANSSGKSFALLVGCTNYYNHPAFALEGPANDIELLRATLSERYRLRPENIAELSEKAAKQLGPDFRPTHDNIKRQFAELAGKVAAGDQVVVLLSGHGSQQPEHDPPFSKYPKPDAKDQIFLAADLGSWDDAHNTMTGAIQTTNCANGQKPLRAAMPGSG